VRTIRVPGFVYLGDDQRDPWAGWGGRFDCLVVEFAGEELGGECVADI
jgi:hypothetical protein